MSFSTPHVREAAGALTGNDELKREGKTDQTVGKIKQIVLIILWLLGLVSSYTMGGFIHILLVIALVVIVVRVLQGRRPLG